MIRASPFGRTLDQARQEDKCRGRATCELLRFTPGHHEDIKACHAKQLPTLSLTCIYYRSVLDLIVKLLALSWLLFTEKHHPTRHYDYRGTYQRRGRSQAQ